jgi:sigma-54 dependent transcriptional regulator, acetoin dehydrogenase operon transcriptional activator AcoR
MSPRGTDLDHEKRINRAWDGLMRSGELVPNTVRPVVENSWRRCHQAGIDPIRATTSTPLTEDELVRRRARELADASLPIMQEAHELLAESGTIMVLADPTGVILETEGDRATQDAAADVCLMTGADWSELARGTNGVGTALSAGGPVQIHAAEHFCVGIKQWTCSATVVRDPTDEEVLVALSVSGLSSAFNQHLLALAVATALA